MATPTDYNHLFRTFLGLPPEKGDTPICGADLPDSWDFPGVARPPCPACQEKAKLS
jgi:hypothetical protein